MPVAIPFAAGRVDFAQPLQSRNPSGDRRVRCAPGVLVLQLIMRDEPRHESGRTCDANLLTAPSPIAVELAQRGNQPFRMAADRGARLVRPVLQLVAQGEGKKRGRGGQGRGGQANDPSVAPYGAPDAGQHRRDPDQAHGDGPGDRHHDGIAVADVCEFMGQYTGKLIGREL